MCECKLNFDGDIDNKVFEDISYIIGATHDLGKGTKFFQEYLEEKDEAKKRSLKAREITHHGLLSAFFTYAITRKYLEKEEIKDKYTRNFPIISFLIVKRHHGTLSNALDEINEIAQNYQLSVIEDAAHALGAIYKGKPIGSISRFTCFSFQAIKHVTTGDGGALSCINKDDETKARRRRWFDIDRLNSKPSLLGEREYDASDIGFKYHMNDLAASIGLGNLEYFESNRQRIKKIESLYRMEFENLSGLKLLEKKPDRESAYWLFTVLVEKRNDFISALKSRGVPASVVHLRIDNNSVFGGIQKDLIQMNEFNEFHVSIPLHCGLNDDDVDKIINSIKAGW